MGHGEMSAAAIMDDRKKSGAFRQPLVDRRRDFALGTTGHVDADVATLERKLGVILRPYVVPQRA